MNDYNVSENNNVKLTDMLVKPLEAGQILVQGLSATAHIAAGCLFANQSLQVEKLVTSLEKIPKLFAEGFFIPFQLANPKVNPIRSMSPLSAQKSAFSKLWSSQRSSDEAMPKDGLCTGAIRPSFLIALARLDDSALKAKGNFFKEKSISWIASRLVAAAFGISMLVTRTADAVISVFALFATIVSYPLSYKFDLHALHRFTYHSFSSLKLIADLAFIGIKILLPSTDTQTVYPDINNILQEQLKKKWIIHSLTHPETTLQEFNEMNDAIQAIPEKEPDFSFMDKYKNAQVLS